MIAASATAPRRGTPRSAGESASWGGRWAQAVMPRMSGKAISKSSTARGLSSWRRSGTISGCVNGGCSGLSRARARKRRGRRLLVRCPAEARSSAQAPMPARSASVNDGDCEQPPGELDQLDQGQHIPDGARGRGHQEQRHERDSHQEDGRVANATHRRASRARPSKAAAAPTTASRKIGTPTWKLIPSFGPSTEKP